MLDRRSLLKQSALLSLSPLVPGFLARTATAAAPERDGRILVVIQLDGGNDGINTVVPVGDELYGKFRRELRIPREQVRNLGQDGGIEVGLHPSLRGAAELFEAGRLAVVQGVGYPNPDRSHFESMAIWQTAKLGADGVGNLGWLGRALDAAPVAGGGPAAVHVGTESMPRAITTRRAVTTSFADASDLALALAHPPAAPAGGDDLAAFVGRTVTNAYATAAELAATSAPGRDAAARYPDTALARRLDLVARSIRAGFPSRVYYAIQPGYDTHAVQLPAHARLLAEFSGALKAFLDDLAASKLADRVAVLAFSEFGRRPEENGSIGTDHGTAGPVFVAGAGVRGGLVGATPRLGALVDGDLALQVDFRSVYATLLDDWLGIPSAGVLGGDFARLPLFG